MRNISGRKFTFHSTFYFFEQFKKEKRKKEHDTTKPTMTDKYTHARQTHDVVVITTKTTKTRGLAIQAR